ncbi:peptidoglycan DD-metalloendopeptidase family protein [Syntrophomonas erecta]
MRKKRLKKNKSAQDPLTFIILPAPVARPIRISISKNTLKIGAALAALFIICSGFIYFKYFTSQADYRQVNHIKEQNQEKDNTITLLTQEIEELESQQEKLSAKQREIRKLMGIKSEDRPIVETSRGGRGGYDAIRPNDNHSQAMVKIHNLKTKVDREEKELDELIARVNNDASYFRALPNQWPVIGDISSPYGWRKSPFGGRSEGFHDGIDIAADVGTLVMAAGDGQVVYAGWKPVFGKTIVIDHGRGMQTLYGHNSELLVSEGDQVHKGDMIARVGTTGRSTGPHLHFSVIKGDKSQDPMIYLPDPEQVE